MSASVEKSPPTPFPALILRLETHNGVVIRTLITPATVDANVFSIVVNPTTRPSLLTAPPAAARVALADAATLLAVERTTLVGIAGPAGLSARGGELSAAVVSAAEIEC